MELVETPLQVKTILGIFHKYEKSNNYIASEIIAVRLISKNLSESKLKLLRKHLCNLYRKFKKKSTKIRQSHLMFLKHNDAWVNKKFRLPKSFEFIPELKEGINNEVDSQDIILHKNRKSYRNCVSRTKRKKIQKVAQVVGDFSTAEILKAVANKNKTKFPELSKLLNLATKHPGSPQEILDKIQRKFLHPNQYSDEEALCLYIDLDLSRSKYNSLRWSSELKGCKIYPSCKKLFQAKQLCIPSPASCVVVTETIAQVPLQNLLNITARRILKSQEDVLNSKSGSKVIKLRLLCSYGYDGSTGHSKFNQNFRNSENSDDSSIFVTSLIPLQMGDKRGNIFWKNCIPQSVRTCRPVRVELTKETDEVILTEHTRMKNEIENLEPILIKLDSGRMVEITTDLYLTIIDGKILAKITGTTSYQRCPICKALPKTFNNLDDIETNFVPNEEFLKHGISPLHAYIRLMEFLLNLSYKLPLEKGRIQGDKDKRVVEQRKNEITRRVFKELGQRINAPRPGGAGTSHTGNLARRVFRNAHQFADILGINVEIVKGFQTILIALNCQLPVSADRFQKYCKTIAIKYIEIYPWNPMSSTVHRILIHGHEIIRSSPLPLGMLGEDAAESRHKLWKSDRIAHSSRNDRVQCLKDIFLRALCTSDPLISAYSTVRRKKYSKKLPLPQLVCDLLEEPLIETDDVSEDSSLEDEETV